ncbi:hypothetical protein L226DRAFT_611821 [Lentinus tigrinus ALCF2SS1-7]|uniref:Uncharacterized protein n=1 Tax=Lentinus tigrinus ALCF2SS1-6 TaxID=1328759 RepID=A0A5C2SKS0_9APHY|nr:hypothetical protein L227DRAFT_650435 [Lentinus tigrinus ALCF2SS1-6]RPD76440.1 hypothetical protein L226DRAFT_611821 [Lentinus tigrinus ALCF2SS1-7]
MSSISTFEEPGYPGPSHLHDSSDLGSSQEREETPSWEPRPLCSALESASKRASCYERQIKELESLSTGTITWITRAVRCGTLADVRSWRISCGGECGAVGKLALDLSNSRAIENLLHEVFTGIQQTRDRTEFFLTDTVPHVRDSLDDDLAVLLELEEQLPEVGSQIRDIRKVYDRGREKAQQLMASLEWLNTPVSQRLRAIIFTPNAPVGKRWKVLVRTVFALVLCACIWIAWITLRGAVRAHRQRLVWGERLMS